MAQEAVARRRMPIQLACAAFRISPTCYRHPAKARYGERRNRRSLDPAGPQPAQPGRWVVLPASAQREGSPMASPAHLPELPRAGTEPANPAEEAHCAGKTGLRQTGGQSRRQSTTHGRWTSCATRCVLVGTFDGSMCSTTAIVKGWASKLVYRCRPNPGAASAVSQSRHSSEFACNHHQCQLVYIGQ